MSMEKERNIDKLAGYLIKLGGLAVIVALCWYFKNILIYIVVAFVVSLIGRPIMKLLKKFHIKKFRLPDWFSAVLTIALIIGFLILIVTQLIPLVTNIVRDASLLNGKVYLESNPVERINEWLIGMFPSLGADFDLVALIMDKLRELVSFSNVSGIVGSVASLVSSAFVGLFAVVFISFSS